MGFIIALVILVVWLWILRRNNKVYSFYNTLIDKACKYNLRGIYDGSYHIRPNAFKWFVGKHSYVRYVFSFKPLKLECWFTEEELKRIKN